MSSYVINLERRIDRKESFITNYNKLGPDLPLVVFNAIDGTKGITDSFKEFISNNNDFNNNSRVIGCAISHMRVWELIANGSDKYGLIFEDDVLFREDSQFKTLFPKIEKNLIKFYEKDPIRIVYFGCGDILPIHVSIPGPKGESLLRSVEKSAHIIRGSVVNDYFGIPKTGSVYVFDWLGAFSYILSKETAIYLLGLVKKEPIKKAIDVYLKDVFSEPFKRYLTIPLLSYHKEYDLNVYDSDTWGISIPGTLGTGITNSIETPKHSRSYSITFIIPTKGRPESLERVIYTLVTFNKLLNITIIICYDSNEEEQYLKTISELRETYGNIFVSISTNKDRMHLHEIYNQALGLCYNSDFIALWEDDSIIDILNYDDILLKYYDYVLENKENSIACFQLRTRDSWTFSCPIITKRFLHIMKEIPTPDINGFLKFISYYSITNIVLRDLILLKIGSKSEEIQRVCPYDREYLRKTLYENPLMKTHINNAINTIKNDTNYRECGIFPEDTRKWKTSPIIGDVDPMAFNKKTF